MLKTMRLLAGLRQIDVHRRVGIWPSRLSMIENGLLRPRDDEIKRLAKVYQTTPEKLCVPKERRDDNAH